MDTDKITRAQSDFLDLQLKVLTNLTQLGAELVGITHESTWVTYKGFSFELRLSFLGLNG